MGEPQEVTMQIMVQEAKEANSADSASITSRSAMEQRRRNYNWWFRISIYIIFLLVGQSVAVLLGRLYFVRGGKSKWMATLVQLIGFPILIPCYFFLKLKIPRENDIIITKSPSSLTLAAIYISFGLLIAVDCFLYSIGLQYLPVSTYTLICASQLAFNAFFSFFLNSQKFTPFIVNSLVLLTISSVLLVFNNESGNPTGVSKVKYAIGFVCTVAASAGYGLVLSLTQLFLRKVAKKQTFKVVMSMIIYPSAVATVVTLIGLFTSGEWNDLTREMNGYQLGKISYLMNLTWTAIIWQIFTIGCVGLIFEVSSLFSNSISVLGLPIVPVLSVFVFHDKMDGVKIISMVLAVWGFLSYVYQHYIDDQNSKAGNESIGQVSKASLLQLEELALKSTSARV
ncbi:hypothetical protein JCGZ_04577 [Jatropha curcas]|uniref:Probable purine permease n=1 Tax=Jatropha curcas TaxID=180498 RepID=A0A067L1E5_JATCU|nr:probable purine permease 10 isoform X1 [Jatropha curcas]XP_037494928.1 probable purine permease 10 isoform X2 [Jatropha curcas]XP_037494929.1 probable purine permease 10 isoform X3 [Jatropha curcas]KDP37934.1 hypothetical protein JCGZ_04577 [Jatropha curcas]